MEKLQEKLDKIADNTKPKASFLVTLTGIGSRLEKTFEPEISITTGCHYEIAFASLETYYSIPNINPTNNILKIQNIDTGKVWKEIVMATGCYGLMGLNDEIQRELKENSMEKATLGRPFQKEAIVALGS